MNIKRLLFYTGIFTLCILQKNVFAQDSVLYRVILIGDAGEIDKEQQALIPDAASKILKNKTTTLFLGDNIYPKGMGLPGTKDELRGQMILRSQFEPLRKQGSSVYFIPGNHDWDKSGKNGCSNKTEYAKQLHPERRYQLFKPKRMCIIEIFYLPH